MFERLGKLIYRHRLATIALWAAVCFAALPGVLGASGVLKTGGYANSSLEAQQVNDELQSKLNIPPNTAIVVFSSPTLRASSPEFIRQTEHALSKTSKLPEVTGITYHTFSPSQVSQDGHAAYEVIGLKSSQDVADQALPKIKNSIQPTSLKTVIGGGPQFDVDTERLSQSDLRRAEILAFPIGLIALLLVFGSVVSAVLPLAMGGIGVVVILGMISGVGRLTDMSIFTLNVATMLGLGLAVDYSLFIVSRFREELHNRSVEEAVVVATAIAGRAVFFSGLTVMVGLAGLITFHFMLLRSIGIAGVIVILVSVLAAITLLPAVLGVLGHRVNSFRLPLRVDTTRNFWGPLSRWVMRHPVSVFVPTLLVLLAFGLPFRNVRLSSPDPSVLPRTAPSRQVNDLLNQKFSQGGTAPILILFQSRGNILQPNNLRAMYAVAQRLEKVNGVESINSIVSLDPRYTLQQYEYMYSQTPQVPDRYAASTLKATTREHVSLMQVATKYSWNDPRQQEIVKRLRNTQLPNGLTIQIGGAAAGVLDIVNVMYGEFPLAIALIVLGSYLVLLFLTRSIVLPLKAIIMNALSIVASYGALVWIFQEGHLSNLLRFEPPGYVETTLPILMFCALFGLSMDYEVFLLSRMKEEWEHTHDNTHSVATGLERSGKIITSAALIVVLVGLSFVSAQIVLVKALGLGIAIAVFLDATLVRALLVPAAMRLIGDLNWWSPRFLRGSEQTAQHERSEVLQ